MEKFKLNVKEKGLCLKAYSYKLILPKHKPEASLDRFRLDHIMEEISVEESGRGSSFVATFHRRIWVFNSRRQRSYQKLYRDFQPYGILLVHPTQNETEILEELLKIETNPAEKEAFVPRKMLKRECIEENDFQPVEKWERDHIEEIKNKLQSGIEIHNLPYKYLATICKYFDYFKDLESQIQINLTLFRLKSSLKKEKLNFEQLLKRTTDPFELEVLQKFSEHLRAFSL
jgi:hypothetical protein